jgi:hypothetical protein
LSDSENWRFRQSQPKLAENATSRYALYIRKYLFGFFGLRRRIHNRNNQEQTERVVLATPLASRDDFRLPV